MTSILRALFVTAAAAAALVAIDLTQVRWDFLAPATCMPDHCFCEAVRPFGVRQLGNTWSNLGFIFVGAMMFSQWRLFGAATAFLGVASAAYHASMTFPGQWLDNVSMYLFPTLLLFPRAVPYLAINIGLAATVWVWPDSRRWVFGALVLTLGLRELIARRPRYRWLAVSAGTLAVSLLLWNLDQARILCFGHAAWHLLNAVAALCLFWYTRENLPVSTGAVTVRQ